MRLLFVHQAFPSQFVHLAPHLAAQPGNEVRAVGEKSNLLATYRPQTGAHIELLGYDMPPPEPSRHAGLDVSLQLALQRGFTVAAGAKEMRGAGFRPDVIVAHPGWGEALFLKDVFPEARLLLYCDNFFSAKSAEIGFDPEFQPPPDGTIQYRLANTPWLISLDAGDWGWSPTEWQRQLFPREYAARMSVIHDGIDTARVAPNAQARFQVPGGPLLGRGEEIVTYVVRNLEPHRGFHVLMRALPELQRRRPAARVVIVGGESSSYSPPLPNGETYRARLLRELAGQIDLSRVHFCGRIPYADYLALLQVSAVHVYLTYPSVLSWSALEAMAAGCLVIGSRTGPVQEAIEDGRNGWLVDFFSPQDLARRLDEALRAGSALDGVRAQARRTVLERYDLKTVCLPAQVKLIEKL
jgi:glycosyltransferase involved in cell wall biosynthesis